MAIEHARNLESLVRAGERASALLRTIGDVGVKMPNSEWTIGEAAAHTISSVRTYGSWATGTSEPEQLGILQKQINREIARVNEERIATVEHTDGNALGDQLRDATRAYADTTKDLPADHPFEWYDHIPMDLRSMTCIELAEVVVHMWDVAQAVGKPWPIDPKDAEQIMLGALSLAPYYVNRETTRGITASFEIRIRRGARVGLRLDDGIAHIQMPPEGRYDCVISADPVDLLLVSYGRIGLAGPLLKGKLLAFGRKPWLGLKFNSYFLKP